MLLVPAIADCYAPLRRLTSLRANAPTASFNRAHRAAHSKLRAKRLARSKMMRLCRTSSSAVRRG